MGAPAFAAGGRRAGAVRTPRAAAARRARCRCCEAAARRSQQGARREQQGDAPREEDAGEHTPRRRRRVVSIVGSGPAGLLCAQRISEASARRAGRSAARVGRSSASELEPELEVHVYERRATPCNRLLLAGRGGLNLTHAEGEAHFLGRYEGSGAAAVRGAVEAFGGAQAVREWASDLETETFVGSSGRVFPTALRATPLLRAWVARLDELGVRMHYRRRMVALERDGASGQPLLRLEAEGRKRTAASGGASAAADGLDGAAAAGEQAAVTLIESDVVVLALGGASWPGLGSDGQWAESGWGQAVGLDVAPLRPANVGFRAHVHADDSGGAGGCGGWGARFVERFAGAWVKDVRLRFGGRETAGDLVFTESGVEGGPIYAISHALTRELRSGRPVEVAVDFRPALSVEALAKRLASGRGGKKRRSASQRLRRAGVSPAALALLYESLGADAAAVLASGPPEALAGAVKAAPLRLAAPMSIARAISTEGGVRFGPGRGEVDERTLAIGGAPGVFVTGEMTDWTAPTGGYLLTGCMGLGERAAEGVLEYLRVCA